MEPTSSVKESKKERNINTNASEHDRTATHVLPIATSGIKSRQEEILDRLLQQQPLYDKSGQITATELSPRVRLTYSDDPKNANQLRQSDDTTVIAGVFALTDDGKNPRHPLLISIDAATLLSDDIAYLPPRHVVFALDIDANHLTPLLPKLRQHQKNGFRILLNYRYGATIPTAISGLIKQARLDVGSLNATELETAVSTLRHHGMQTLIASNIRCQETLDLCIRLKFEEFQGSYFEHERQPQTRPPEISRLRLLELMDRVLARRDLAEIESLIKLDARLSYQLIAYLNTLDDNGGVISSLTQALHQLKHDGLYRWLTLLLHTSVDASPHSVNLLKRGLSRAYFLEAMAHKSLQRVDPQAMHLLGLLSVTDKLTGYPLPQLIGPLRLDPDIREALLEHKGISGLMLILARAAENGDQGPLEDYAARCLINPVEVNLAMINALVIAESADL